MATATTSTSTPTIALVGGGIGGLSLAIALHTRHVPFHIYEAAPAFAEIGAGVALNGSAQRAMRLVDPRIVEGFQHQATYNTHLKDHWFQFRWGMDGRGAPNKDYKAGDVLSELTAPGMGMSAVHRAHFLDELIKLLPEDCASFGHKLTRVDDMGEEVKLFFSNGTSATHSAVVGCDGIKSHVRDSLLGKDYRAVFSGKYAYRGLLDMETAAGLLGDVVARNSQMHIGYGGHMLHMPVEHGKTLNVVAFQTKEDGKWEDERWVMPMDRQAMEADFADWGDNVKKVLSLMQKPDCWALFDHPPAPTFFRNRVCLMGDAAHASTPHQGSGAGFAIGDAFVLGSALGLAKSPEHIPAAFEAFNAVRRLPGLRLVETSRECGRVWDFQGKGIGDDAQKFDRDVQTRLDWILTEDLEGEAAEVKRLFEESVKGHANGGK